MKVKRQAVTKKYEGKLFNIFYGFLVDLKYFFKKSWLTITSIMYFRLHWEDLQHCIVYLLRGARGGIYSQGCSKNFFRKSNFCTFFEDTNVLECRIKSNAVYNIYAWSNHSDLHNCIIMIKPSVKVPNLSYRVVYDKYIAKYLMFVEALNIVQSWFDMLVKHYWMVCLKELNKD